MTEAEVFIVPGSGVIPGRHREDTPGMNAKLRTIALSMLLKDTKTEAVVFSGGRTAGKDHISEAEAMRRYLSRNILGVDDTLTIHCEEDAVSTEENLVNAMQIIREKGYTGSIRIITNGFHVPRVRALCGKLNLSADVISAEPIVSKRSAHHRQLLEQIDQSPQRAQEKRRELFARILQSTAIGESLLHLLTKLQRS